MEKDDCMFRLAVASGLLNNGFQRAEPMVGAELNIEAIRNEMSYGSLLSIRLFFGLCMSVVIYREKKNYYFDVLLSPGFIL